MERWRARRRYHARALRGRANRTPRYVGLGSRVARHGRGEESGAKVSVFDRHDPWDPTPDPGGPTPRRPTYTVTMGNATFLKGDKIEFIADASPCCMRRARQR